MGSAYCFRSDEPESHVRQIAEEVDERMRTVARLQPHINLARIGVLVSMQLVSEIHQLRQENEKLKAMLEQLQSSKAEEEKKVDLAEPGLTAGHPSRWRFEKRIYPLEGKGGNLG